MAAPDAWRMHGEGTPIFAEYLLLAGDAGWADLVSTADIEVRSNDVLIVVDMQNDFLPRDTANPDGGAFAVAEGSAAASLITQLIEHFGSKGALVVATRDYHPKKHSCFLPQGPFPEHCVQGTIGSHFYQPIGDCIQSCKKIMGRDVEVVFKGFHQAVDSFGCLRYPSEEATWERLSHEKEPKFLQGCSLEEWTGCFCLPCSNMDQDIDAPPDVCSVLERVSLNDLLASRGAERIFCCGLAYDFCVLDTALNGAKAGFKDIAIILDASRPAHIPGLGKFGSGFLSDPDEIKTKMAANGVRLTSASALMPGFKEVPVLNEKEKIRQSFPSQLGPFSLVAANKISLTLDRQQMHYKASSPKDLIKALEQQGITAEGAISQPCSITLGSENRKAIGIPQGATKFCWAYPVQQGRFQEYAREYLATTSPSAGFLTYGGFLYLDDKGKVLKVMAMAVGSGLSFAGPEPWRPQYTEALQERWQPVTLPFLQRKGAEMFAWFNPGEVLHSSVGEPWCIAEHGAFAYLMHKDGDEQKGLVFPVVDFAKGTPSCNGRIATNDEATQMVLQALRDAVKDNVRDRVELIKLVQAQETDLDQEVVTKLVDQELARNGLRARFSSDSL